MPTNVNKRAREGSSSSKTPDKTDSDITLKSVMQKLECIQDTLDSNFAEAMIEINSLRVDVNARLSILKNATDELKTSLDAAWVEIEALKQQDEQNKLQLQCRSRVKIIGGAHHERQSHEVLGSPGECSSGKFLYRGSLK